MLEWKFGMQNFTYKKFILIKFNIFDCYLIKLNKFCDIPWHTDKVDNGKHHRVNILIFGKYVQLYEEKPIWFNKYITFFRPDINKHMIGTGNNIALVLSIGWVTNV